MAFIVVYDACVLFPAPLRDLLVRLARTDLFQAKWTERILDETFDAILDRRPDLTADRLQRTRELMNQAVRDVLVTDYEDLIDGLELPDPDDRHVLAAAIRSGAQAIVTRNKKDFPDDTLEAYDIEAQTPDTFLQHILTLPRGRSVFAQVVRQQAAALRNPPQTAEQILATLESNGLEQAIAFFRGEHTNDETR